MLENNLIQNQQIAQFFADDLLAVFKKPGKDIELSDIGNFALKLGDHVTVTDSISSLNNEYHLLEHELTYDGALSSRIRARGIIPPEAPVLEIETLVLASNGDCEVVNTTFNNTDTTHDFGNNTHATDKVAFRFPVSIPANAYIKTAKLTFQAASTKTGATVNLTIDAESGLAPTAITSTADFNARVKTTANVAWNSVPSFTTDVSYDSPELKTVIQENVSLGVVTALQFFVQNNASTAGAYRDIYTFDAASLGKASAKLYIEYYRVGF